MITLYDYLPSQNAWKIRCLLNQLEQPYTQTFISIFEGEGQNAEYLKINPTGAVPAISMADGTTLAESNAILMYLADTTEFLPAQPYHRAQIVQWLCFESDYVQSSVATLRHWVMTGKDKNRSHDVLSDKINASKKTLSVLDRYLAEYSYLVNDRYTIADISVYAYVHLANETGLTLDDYPNLQRWITDVKSQPRHLNKVYPYSIDKHSYKEL